jgi:hypothetical protein
MGLLALEFCSPCSTLSYRYVTLYSKQFQITVREERHEAKTKPKNKNRIKTINTTSHIIPCCADSENNIET